MARVCPVVSHPACQSLFTMSVCQPIPYRHHARRGADALVYKLNYNVT